MKTWLPWEDSEWCGAWGLALVLVVASIIFGGGQGSYVLAYAASCLLVTGVSFGRNRSGCFRLFGSGSKPMSPRAAWMRILMLAAGLSGLGLLPGVAGFLLTGESFDGAEMYLASMMMIWLATVTTVPWCAWILQDAIFGCMMAAGLHLGLTAGLIYIIAASGLMNSWDYPFNAVLVPFIMPILLTVAGVFLLGRMTASLERATGVPLQLRRIWKETRALGWAWVGAIVVPIIVVRMTHSWSVFWVASSLTLTTLACLVFGHEYQHQTLGLLLSQPVSRRRLWYEKMGLAFAVVTITVAITHPVAGMSSFDIRNDGSMPLVWMPLMAVLAAVTTAPTILLFVRHILAAITFTPLLHYFTVTMTLALLAFCEPDLTDSPEARAMAMLASIVLSGLMYLLGCWRFNRLEWAQPRESPLPGISWIFKRSTSFGSKGRGPAWINLAIKELQLHRIGIWLAGGFCLLNVIMIATNKMNLTGHSAGLFDFGAPAFILAIIWMYLFVAPLVIGSVSVADERSIGLWEWHLTLPPSRKSQWWIKVMVVYGVQLVFGLLLPMAWLKVFLSLGLIEPNSWQAPLWPIVLTSCCITCVAIYTSSFSQSAVKALLMALGMLTVGLIAFALLMERFRPDQLFRHYAIILGEDISDAWLRTVVFLIGTSFFVGTSILAFFGLINWLSWSNYRRMSVETLMHQVLIPILLVLGGSLLAVIEVHALQIIFHG